MLEHRQATDGRNPFCASPLNSQDPTFRLRRFTFYLRVLTCRSSTPKSVLHSCLVWMLFSRGHYYIIVSVDLVSAVQRTVVCVLLLLCVRVSGFCSDGV